MGNLGIPRRRCGVLSSPRAVVGERVTTLRRCLSQRYVPLMGTALFLEYESVLARHHLFANCRLNRQQRDMLFDAFVSACQWQPVYYTWRPNLIDEADNHIIELAVAGQAGVIVTNNTRDFERAELYFSGLRILPPNTFIQETS